MTAKAVIFLGASNMQSLQGYTDEQYFQLITTMTREFAEGKGYHKVYASSRDDGVFQHVTVDLRDNFDLWKLIIRDNRFYEEDMYRLHRYMKNHHNAKELTQIWKQYGTISCNWNNETGIIQARRRSAFDTVRCGFMIDALWKRDMDLDYRLQRRDALQNAVEAVVPNPMPPNA